MPTASELADDRPTAKIIASLQRLMAAREPSAIMAMWLDDNAPEILSALRQVEVMRGALKEIVEIGDEAKRHGARDDFDRGARAARGEAADIARTALTGEA